MDASSMGGPVSRHERMQAMRTMSQQALGEKKLEDMGAGEDALIREMQRDAAPISASLRQWEEQARAVKARIDERDATDMNDKVTDGAAAAAEREAAERKVAADLAAAQRLELEQAEAQALLEVRGAARVCCEACFTDITCARQAKARAEAEADEFVRLPSELQWTDSPAVSRKGRGKAGALRSEQWCRWWCCADVSPGQASATAMTRTTAFASGRRPTRARPASPRRRWASCR